MRMLAFLLLPLIAAGCSRAADSPQASAALTNAAQAAPSAYSLVGTEVRDIHSHVLNRDYQVFISLPQSYAAHPDARYPAVFVADGDFGFPVIRSIGNLVARHSDDLQDFILVGLSYSHGDSGEFSRDRDYTPVPREDEADVDTTGRKLIYGESKAYRTFLKTEVFPLIATAYRADMHRAVFAGHSYGGLLGADILLNDPEMFSAYILSSPSLWFGKREIFRREGEYARLHKDLPARVYMSVGGFETTGNGPRYNASRDMVGDMRGFAGELASRHYPHLTVESHVVDGEDHLSVAAINYTHGLYWALGKGR